MSDIERKAAENADPKTTSSPERAAERQTTQSTPERTAENRETPRGADAHASDLIAPQTRPFTAKEWLLTLAALAVAFLGLQSTVFGNGLGFGVTASALLLIAVSYAYIRAEGGKPRRSSYFYLALTVAAACLYSLSGAHGGMVFLRFPLLAALYGYWLCAASGTASADTLAPSAVRDALYALFSATLGGLGETARGMTGGLRGKKNAPLALAGLVIALPLLVIVISLLSGADESFANAVAGMTAWFSRSVGNALFRFVLTAFGALLLVSQWLRVARDRRGAMPTRPPQRFLPLVIPCVVIALLCAVYIAFFAAQAASVAKAAKAGRGAFSHSDFARSGFFQLCVVCGINFVVVLIANYLTDRRGMVLRVLNTLLCVCTLLLTASAISKMALYIRLYGLTPLRVTTSWFMLVLAVAFLMILLSQWREGAKVFKVSALTLCVSFLALCALNPAKISADYNADAYLRGALPAFDYEAFSYDAPYAADAVARVFNETDDETLKSELVVRFGDKGTLFVDPLGLNLNAEQLHAAPIYKELGKQRQAFLMNVTLRADVETYGVRVEYAVDGVRAGESGMRNADGSPLLRGETVTFDFLFADFPGRADLASFTAQFYLEQKSGEFIAAGEPIQLSPVFGRAYPVTIRGGLSGLTAELTAGSR